MSDSYFWKLFYFFVSNIVCYLFFRAFEIYRKIEQQLQRGPIHLLPLHTHNLSHYYYPVPQWYIFTICEPH